MIDQARHRHHQHRSKFKEAIDYLDQIFEDLKKECDVVSLYSGKEVATLLEQTLTLELIYCYVYVYVTGIEYITFSIYFYSFFINVTTHTCTNLSIHYREHTYNNGT